MKDLIASEFTKIRTTRTVYWLFAAMLGLVAFGVVTTSHEQLGVEQFGSLGDQVPLVEQEFLFMTGSIVWLFVLLVGLRSSTDEFRYGTIVPALLANPARARMLMAKVAVVGTTAIVFFVCAYASALAIGIPRLGPEGAATAVATTAMASLLGKVALMSIAWAAMGVAIGLAVRHQAAAIAGSLVWIMFVEMFMEGYAEHIVRFLPVHATTALVGPPSVGTGGVGDIVLSTLPGGLVLAGWAAAWCVFGAIVMHRRDIA